MLKRLDRSRNRIRFTDITAKDFRAEETGKSFQALMGSIHGRDKDGNLIEGVEVFRVLYEAVGFPRMVWASRLPVLRDALRLAYTVFSRYRLRLTGRAGACTEDRCHLVKTS
jgi:predicted DCC family thiol-disulfide oxidoreductase YuxK